MSLKIPKRLKAWAFIDCLVRPQLEKWEWLHPIHDYVSIELYEPHQAEEVAEMQEELRKQDDRYYPKGKVFPKNWLKFAKN